MKGIRFWFSFQSPELGRLWGKHTKLGEEDDEQYISDRLSFFTRREGEEIVPNNINENGFWAILMIDI